MRVCVMFCDEAKFPIRALSSLLLRRALSFLHPFSLLIGLTACGCIACSSLMPSIGFAGAGAATSSASASTPAFAAASTAASAAALPSAIFVIGVPCFSMYSSRFEKSSSIQFRLSATRCVALQLGHVTMTVPFVYACRDMLCVFRKSHMLQVNCSSKRSFCSSPLLRRFRRWRRPAKATGWWPLVLFPARLIAARACDGGRRSGR